MEQQEEGDHSLPSIDSETWDPSSHVRLHFPVLTHPDARPEQAPSRGVRELLYQYEALQATSNEPLNIFWNDEEERGGLVQEQVNDPPARRARSVCSKTLILVGLLCLCSCAVLIVGTVCVFGNCTGGNDKEEEVEKEPPTSSEVIVTRHPTAAPTPITNNHHIFPEGNIFAPRTHPPTSAPPTSLLKPTQQPTALVSTVAPTIIVLDTEESNASNWNATNITFPDNITNITNTRTNAPQVQINATDEILMNSTAEAVNITTETASVHNDTFVVFINDTATNQSSFFSSVAMVAVLNKAGDGSHN